MGRGSANKGRGGRIWSAWLRKANGARGADCKVIDQRSDARAADRQFSQWKSARQARECTGRGANRRFADGTRRKLALARRSALDGGVGRHEISTAVGFCGRPENGKTAPPGGRERRPCGFRHGALTNQAIRCARDPGSQIRAKKGRPTCIIPKYQPRASSHFSDLSQNDKILPGNLPAVCRPPWFQAGEGRSRACREGKRAEPLDRPGS